MRVVLDPGDVIAVIDVGSNSVRLLLVRELSAVAFEVIDEERFDARLGQGQRNGMLTEAAMERGLQAIRVAHEIAAAMEPAAIVVAGTEALRRAPNAQEFIDGVREQTGLTVRVLSTAEEGYASFLGAINSTGMRDGYMVDIGGGSLEVMRVADGVLAEGQSAPLGAIYSTERYLGGDPPTSKELRALRKAVREQIRVQPGPGTLIGIGGAVRNLARIERLKRKYPLRRLHGLVIPRVRLHSLAEQLAGATHDQRRRMPGVSTNRADILPAAAVVIDEVMAMTGAKSLMVAGQGLREGLVWQQIRGEGAVLPDVRAASVSGLQRANGVDELAAEPVVAVATRLFEATHAQHGLGAQWLDLLCVAARIAGIGMHVDYYNRDRHAEYLVHSGDLHGFSHREIVLLGATVRWAISGTPDLTPYNAILEPDDLRAVGVLTALLGTAAAVRRRKPSPVLHFAAEATAHGLDLRIGGAASVEAELVALGRQARRLEAALRVPVKVSVTA